MLLTALAKSPLLGRACGGPRFLSNHPPAPPLPPLNTSSYEKLRTYAESGGAYVDKTLHIARLLRYCERPFLVRPFRWGKSLMLDTVREIYTAENDRRNRLFGNTQLATRLDPQTGLSLLEAPELAPRPVLYLDLARLPNVGASAEDPSTMLRHHLHGHIVSAANRAGIETLELMTVDPNAALISALQTLGERSADGKVVVLIDGYDRPITALLEADGANQIAAARSNLAVLSSFFETLSDQKHRIHRRIVSGGSRLAQAALGEDFEDITMDARFHELLGYTPAEIEQTFGPNLAELCRRGNHSRTTLMHLIQRWYGGYSWTGFGEKLLNPYSVNMLLTEYKFKCWWGDSDTMRWLSEILRKSHVQPALWTSRWTDIQELSKPIPLDALGRADFEPSALMLQAGYTTVAAREMRPEEEEVSPQVLSGYPNLEIYDTVMKQLLGSEEAQHWRVSMHRKVFDLVAREDWEAFAAVIDEELHLLPNSSMWTVRETLTALTLFRFWWWIGCSDAELHEELIQQHECMHLGVLRPPEGATPEESKFRLVATLSVVESRTEEAAQAVMNTVAARAVARVLEQGIHKDGNPAAPITYVLVMVFDKDHNFLSSGNVRVIAVSADETQPPKQVFPALAAQ